MPTQTQAAKHLAKNMKAEKSQLNKAKPEPKTPADKFKKYSLSWRRVKAKVLMGHNEESRTKWAKITAFLSKYLLAASTKSKKLSPEHVAYMNKEAALYAKCARELSKAKPSPMAEKLAHFTLKPFVEKQVSEKKPTVVKKETPKPVAKKEKAAPVKMKIGEARAKVKELGKSITEDMDTLKALKLRAKTRDSEALQKKIERVKAKILLNKKEYAKIKRALDKRDAERAAAKQPAKITQPQAKRVRVATKAVQDKKQAAAEVPVPAPAQETKPAIDKEAALKTLQEKLDQAKQIKDKAKRITAVQDIQHKMKVLRSESFDSLSSEEQHSLIESISSENLPDWFVDLGVQGQKTYLKMHPRSSLNKGLKALIKKRH